MTTVCKLKELMGPSKGWTVYTLTMFNVTMYTEVYTTTLSLQTTLCMRCTTRTEHPFQLLHFISLFQTIPQPLTIPNPSPSPRKTHLKTYFNNSNERVKILEEKSCVMQTAEGEKRTGGEGIYQGGLGMGFFKGSFQMQQGHLLWFHHLHTYVRRSYRIKIV